MNLPSLRKQIDRIDLRLLHLLNRRATLAVRVGALKRTQGRPVFDGRREEVVLRQVGRANHGPLPTVSIHQIFQAILRHNRKLEVRAHRNASGSVAK